MNRHHAIAAVPVALLALLVTACGGSTSGGRTAAGTTRPPATGAAPTGTGATGGTGAGTGANGGTGAGAATGGYLTAADLAAQPVDLPAWQRDGSRCPSGPYRLIDSHTPGWTVNRAGNVDPHGAAAPPVFVWAVADTVAGGRPVTAALISCQWGAAAEDRVVAFARSASGGIVTVGSLVEGSIWSVHARAGGGVVVDISQMQACCATPQAWEDHQTRAYTLVNGRSVQVGGPGSFISHPVPIRLAVAVLDTSWTTASDGGHVGVLTVRITNEGGWPSNPIVLTGGPGGSVRTPVPGIRAGGSRTVSVTVHVAAGDQPVTNGFDNAVDAYELGSLAIAPGNAPNPANARATFSYWG